MVFWRGGYFARPLKSSPSDTLILCDFSTGMVPDKLSSFSTLTHLSFSMTIQANSLRQRERNNQDKNAG